MDDRILVFNCHEAWVHQLGMLARPLDIVVGLPGRHVRGWDTHLRPVPPNGRLVDLREVQHSRRSYACVIAHNLTDLLDAKNINSPKLLMLHVTLDSIFREQNAKTDPEAFRLALNRYLQQTGVHPVAVSRLKGRSWGYTDDIVPPSADPALYPEFEGGKPLGLRVSNFVTRRAQTL